MCCTLFGADDKKHICELQTPKAFEVKADMPGVDKKDVKVNVDGDVLSLSVEQNASKNEDKEEEGVKYHR